MNGVIFIDIMRIACMLSAVLLSLISLSGFIISLLYEVRRRILINGIWLIIDTFLFISVTDAFQDGGGRTSLGRIIESIGPLSMLFLIIAFLALAALRALGIRKLRRESVTPFSIGEALDTMPMGISFSTEEGVLLQTNRTMEEIHDRLSPDLFVDTRKFWDRLSELGADRVPDDSPVDPAAAFARYNVSRDSDTGDRSCNPIINPGDGRSWMFLRNAVDTPLGKLHEYTAVDVTDEIRVKQELEEKVGRLARFNQKLRDYNREVDETVKREELLSARRKIHERMGSALLAANMYLTNEESPVTKEELYNMWTRDLGLLSFEAGEDKAENGFSRFRDAAGYLGIDLQVAGNMPPENTAAELIAAALQESLSNAVEHAKADQVYITVREDVSEYYVRISNNGIPVKDAFAEGGGLSKVRKKAEKAGAEISYPPGQHFILQMIIPKQA